MQHHPAFPTSPSELEFVLLSNDYATMNAVAGGVKKFGSKFSLVPTPKAAHDCLARRKVDGVFVDMAVGGALELIEAIRTGTSNSKGVIFACILSTKESTATLSAGANFLLRKPLSIESVGMHLTIAKDLLVRERRRYFRHSVNLPVILRDGEAELHGRLTNVSEEGLAVRMAKPLKHSSSVDFSFELSFGMKVSGKGQVAWTNTEAMAGILIRTFLGTSREHLDSWITSREQLALKSSTP